MTVSKTQNSKRIYERNLKDSTQIHDRKDKENLKIKWICLRNIIKAIKTGQMN